MATTNVYFDHDYREEQYLVEDLIIEALGIYGQPTYYIPRGAIRDDEILNEEYSRFSDAYAIEMYIENTSGFEGEGTLLSKFGIEIRDQATFIISRRRFRQLVEIDSNAIRAERPREGDLVYLPLSNSLFEIKFVEHEQPFYQLNDLPTYKLQCELFEYSHEDIDTGIPGVDQFQSEHASRTVIALSAPAGTGGFAPREEIAQRIQEFKAADAALTAIVDVETGTVTSVRIDESGFGYDTPPTINFPVPLTGSIAQGTATINSAGEVTSVTVTDPGSGYTGDVEITDITPSPVDDRPEINVLGEVAKFTRTEVGVSGGLNSEADLEIVNVRADDGSLSEFIPGGENLRSITQEIDDTGWSVAKVYSLTDVDKYIPSDVDDFADNARYEIDAEQILDFSESNPFGDPSVN